MLGWLTASSRRRALASELYGSIVAAARAPRLYAELGAPDTPDGRYEMIALHLILVMERLRREGADGEDLSRLVVERFVVDMDDALREMGVGDLSVPRKVKRAAVGLYERAADYRPAIEAADYALATEPLARRLGFDGPTAAAGLARHMVETATALGRWPAPQIFAGRLPGSGPDMVE